jgi:hypothetical protein
MEYHLIELSRNIQHWLILLVNEIDIDVYGLLSEKNSPRISTLECDLIGLQSFFKKPSMGPNILTEILAQLDYSNSNWD